MEEVAEEVDLPQCPARIGRVLEYIGDAFDGHLRANQEVSGGADDAVSTLPNGLDWKVARVHLEHCPPHHEPVLPSRRRRSLNLGRRHLYLSISLLLLLLDDTMMAVLVVSMSSCQ